MRWWSSMGWGHGGMAPMGVALLAGAAVPFQAASNAALGRSLGHPLWATLCSLGVSVLMVLPLLGLMRVPWPNVGAAMQAPAWVWLGGVAGVAYVTAALMLAPKLGVAGFMACALAGQMLASLLIDHHGWMGLTAKPVGGWRIGGVALIVLGALLVQWGSKPPAVSGG